MEAMSSPTLPLPARAGTSLTGGLLAVIAALSGLAAGIHLSVAPEHFDEWWGYGMFFLAAAAGECALVLLLALRPRSWVIQAGIWTSLATMLMYVVSRTSGIPLGPGKGSVETVDLPGLAATAAEGALVVVLCLLLAGRERRYTLNALGVVGVALWAAALAGALAPPAQPVESAHGTHAAPHEQMAGAVPFIPDSVRNAPRPPGDG
jgi:hypothetical protein